MFSSRCTWRPDASSSPLTELLLKMNDTEIIALEAPIEIMNNEDAMQNAERINGLSAMLGIIAALGAYATTGQIIPGIF